MVSHPTTNPTIFAASSISCSSHEDHLICEHNFFSPYHTSQSSIISIFKFCHRCRWHHRHRCILLIIIINSTVTI